MLPFIDRPFIYFPPKPSRFFSALAKLYSRHYYLASPEHRIISVENRNSETIKQLASDKRNKLLFLSNHPSHSDSQILIEAFRQLGMSTNFLASYDLFLRKNNFHRWVMRIMGVFSVDRESFNSRPIKEAIHTLLDTRYSLTIFSEGRPYLQNDIITDFQPGGSFIAQSAQKALDARNRDERVFLIPIAIKLTHTRNCRDNIRDLLQELNDFLDLIPDRDDRIEDTLERAAVALMDYGLKASHYPPSEGKTTKERQQSSGELIIKSLEKEMKIVTENGTTMNDRILNIRNRIHKVMLNPDGNSGLWAQSRIWAQKIMLAMKILSYPLDYLKEQPTLDRCGEVIERLVEDKQSKAIPAISERTAIVNFGEPFTLSERNTTGKMSRNELLSATTTYTQEAIQKMLNQINLTNRHEGGQLF